MKLLIMWGFFFPALVLFHVDHLPTTYFLMKQKALLMDPLLFSFFVSVSRIPKDQKYFHKQVLWETQAFLISASCTPGELCHYKWV